MLAILVRSAVAPQSNYRGYVDALRVDFWFSCAYCTIAEFEAAGIRFTVDHYVPQDRDPSKVAEYENLMWCCDTCNIHKGVRPTDVEMGLGFRFFRPDQDLLDAHFELKGIRLEGRTREVGEYTIQVLNLNGQPLRRLREIRERLFQSAAAVAAGTRALDKVSIETLPTASRMRFLELRAQLKASARHLDSELDDVLLREFNRSPLLDKDPNAGAVARERREFLKGIKALAPDPVGSKRT